MKGTAQGVRSQEVGLGSGLRNGASVEPTKTKSPGTETTEDVLTTTTSTGRRSALSTASSPVSTAPDKPSILGKTAISEVNILIGRCDGAINIL